MTEATINVPLLGQGAIDLDERTRIDKAIEEANTAANSLVLAAATAGQLLGKAGMSVRGRNVMLALEHIQTGVLWLNAPFENPDGH